MVDTPRPPAPRRRPSRAPKGPAPASASWEATVLSGMDRVLRASLGQPGPDERAEPSPPRAAPRSERRGAPVADPPRSGLRRWIGAPAKPAGRRTRTLEIGVAIVALLFAFTQRPSATAEAGTAAPGAAGPALESVAMSLTPDGSVQLQNGVRVQMLGVTLPGADDAPVVAQTAMRTLADVVKGQHVVVEYDPLLPAQAQEGQPTQVGYVWFVGPQGERRGMLNALVLRYGFGRPVVSVSYRYRTRFAEATRIAQQQHAGVWMGL